MKDSIITTPQEKHSLEIAALLKTEVGKWLLEQNKGKTISFTWDGGHDSGWGHIEIDEDEVVFDETGIADFLADKLLDCIGYGSFCGEYTTTGTLEFNPDTGCFEGDDHYYTTDWEEKHIDITLEIPTDIWYDEVRILMNEETSAVSLIVKNGPLVERHRVVEDSMAEILTQALFEELGDERYSSEKVFLPTKDDFKRPFFTVNIESLDVQIENCKDTGFSFEVLEFAHQFYT